MAIASTTVWEIRSTATAGNVNGGGFNPARAGAGTDYSQQDASQYNAADLAGTNANTATPTVTSASHTFVSSDIGNIIFISAGSNWTVGRYEIISVAGGAATLDRACASVASPTGGTYRVGGALSLGSSDSTIFQLAPANGANTFWVKAGNYTPTAANSFNAGGTQGNHRIIGYNSTRGDEPTGTNRPFWDMSTNTFALNTNWEMKNISLRGSATNVLTVNGANIIKNVKCMNVSTTTNRNAFNLAAADASLIECEAISYRGNAVSASLAHSVVSCYIHSSAVGYAFAGGAGAVVVARNVISNCTSKAINVSGGATSVCSFLYNTLFGGATPAGIGIDFATGSTDMRVMGNVISGFTTGVNHADSAQTIGYDDWNNYYNNTTDSTNWTRGANDVDLDPEWVEVVEMNGTTATTSGNDLTQIGADFSNVVPGRDYLWLVSGTGITAGIYGITSVPSATVLTLDIAPGTNATANKVWRIIRASNFTPGVSASGMSVAQSFPGGTMTNYFDMGAIQRDAGSLVCDFPALSDVRSGVTFGAGTGTLDLPAEANVKTGVTYDGATKTGTYTGSDRWTDPAEANVRFGISYKANSTTNNKTGTLNLPAEADVRDGTTYDAGTKTGTLDLPDEADVALGIVFDNGTKTGTADIITANQVAQAVWDALLTDHNGPGTFGEFVQDISGGGSAPTASEIADAVWDEATADHTAPGSFGEHVGDLTSGGGGGATAGEIADAVWDEAMSGHSVSGSYGAFVKKLLTVGKFLGLK